MSRATHSEDRLTLIEEKYDIAQAEQIEMLRKLLLYWDGQWFLKTVEEFGLEAGVRTNARVRSSFGRLEMRAILKAARKKKADDLADALVLLNSYLDVFMGERLKAVFSLMSDTEAHIAVTHCPAYEGAKRAHLERTDQACVACAGLWPTWLSVLLPDNDITVDIPEQQGRGDSRCLFNVHMQKTR